MISSHQQEVREDRPPPQGLTDLHVETVPTLRSYLAPFSCSCQTCPGDPRMMTSLFKYDKPVFLMNAGQWTETHARQEQRPLKTEVQPHPPRGPPASLHPWFLNTAVSTVCFSFSLWI